MNRFIPARRSGKVVLGLAAAAITGLAIAGGTAAANAAPSAPAAVTSGGTAAPEVMNCTVDLAPAAAGVASNSTKPQNVGGKDEPVVENSECTGTGGDCAGDLASIAVGVASNSEMPQKVGDKPDVVNSECEQG